MMGHDEEYDAEWFAALRRAVDLIDEQPTLEPDTIIAALDDEFCGGPLLPSGDTALVTAIRSNFVQMTTEKFADIVRDVDVDRTL